ncbi:uncharacterized protein LOC115874123 [Sitophilus oryzae]|uniref:Uncharacterized protein LOC115874123 n=1 Tax=Sitophilus oryzae TaxID=7048 RepID=A0A6J2X1K6_SITOR|nr:uncharacterized protein LOC115874123 [Sitophilus oryzae]
MALRICSAYHTILTDAVLVIAGLIPLHLAAKEKRELYVKAEINDKVKKQQRRGTYQKWQEEWDTSDKGRWTRKLIHNVEDWTSSKYGDVDYYITQFLSGHGVFRDFLQYQMATACTATESTMPSIRCSVVQDGKTEGLPYCRM